jgi:nucleoside-diphosphate-sugar epimerase
MPSASSQTVLVTGASGFVASHILKTFLAHEYNVRGTVRSQSAADSVKKTHPQYANQLSFAIVPDIAAPNAFEEASKGMSGIIHTASPFFFAVTDNEKDLLLPAIQGTINALEAAAKNPTVKRVVITSSFAAILDPMKGYRPGYTYTENDWNPVTYESAKTEPNAPVAYVASKKLAEKAAWDWMEQHKPNFSLTTLCPPWILGPLLNTPSSMSKLNESSEVMYNLINGSQNEIPATDFAAFADVRDVAQAHLLSYELDTAIGQRFIIAGGKFSYQSVADYIRKSIPELRNATPEGNPGAGEKEETYCADGIKAEKVLGLKYTSLEATSVDTAWALVKMEKKLAA